MNDLITIVTENRFLLIPLPQDMRFAPPLISVALQDSIVREIDLSLPRRACSRGNGCSNCGRVEGHARTRRRGRGGGGGGGRSTRSDQEYVLDQSPPPLTLGRWPLTGS